MDNEKIFKTDCFGDEIEKNRADTILELKITRYNEKFNMKVRGTRRKYSLWYENCKLTTVHNT